MTTFKRFSLALAISLFALLINARAQTPQVSTVNVTPDEQRVRISAVGDVLDMRVAVSDESGDVVFESGPVAGDKLDWAMRDPQGQRVPPGSYNLTVTYRTSAGKLRRRVEQVLVTEEVTGEAKQETAAPAPAAPVQGAGSTGKIAKFTAANTVGNSVMTESAARIGINTAAPTHALTINGGPSWTASHWVGSIALPNLGSIGWGANSAGQRRGLGHGNGGLIFFRTASNPGAATGAITPDLVIGNTGNVGVGTATPAAKLSVNGGIQILGAGNGIKFADGSIQTKATAGTITGTGTANRLAKFTGPNSFGNSTITEVASGNVGIGTASPVSKLTVVTPSASYGIIHKAGTVEVGTWAGAGSAPEGGWLGTKSSHPLYLFTAGNSATMTLTPYAGVTFEGNMGQNAGSSGLPKAMIRMQGDGTPVDCYNGVTKVRSSSFASCGFSVTPAGGAAYTIDFGSAVSGSQYQFYSLSGSSSIILSGYPGTKSISVIVGNTTFGYVYYIIVY